MPRRLLLVLALALPALAWTAEPAGGAAPASSPPPAWEGRPAWASPVDGGVARAYDYARGAPFARGAHRGIDLATHSGARVAAPCAGTVTHAGPVPGHARGVTIACARAASAPPGRVRRRPAAALVATVLDLRATAVAKGARIGRGARVGAARGATVHVGARRAGDPFGYVEPPIAAAPPGFDPVPAPSPGTRPLRRPVPAPRVARPPRRVPAPRPAPVPRRNATARRSVPSLAWGGLALLAGAAPAGAVTWRRRRRRPRHALVRS